MVERRMMRWVMEVAVKTMAEHVTIAPKLSKNTISTSSKAFSFASANASGNASANASTIALASTFVNTMAGARGATVNATSTTPGISFGSEKGTTSKAIPTGKLQDTKPARPDWLPARLPPRTKQTSSCQNGPSAFCLVGNIRTLPYTMGSIERFAIANSLDVYMVLQRGQKRGSSWLTYSADFYGSAAEDSIIRKLQQLRSLRNDSGGVQLREIIEVKDGTCNEYRRNFQPRQKVLRDADCKEHSSNSQIRWLRTCFDRVLASGVKYGRIVRGRPDVALFRDIRLSSYPCGKLYVPYKNEPAPVGGDWFFFLDFTLLQSWWASVEAASKAKFQQWPFPDFYMFATAANTLKYVHLPAVIVRSPNVVECCRLSQDRGREHSEGASLDQECRQLLQKGAFSKRWPSFDFRQAKSNSEPQLRFSASGNLMFTLPQSTASKTWGLSEQFCAC
ncbi:unnamed protein product [Symbiodinium natans]|uniref:Uncharacterized protein n=1 Tax=Symbiodinium natans TaxID=878477 RepID=A0A812V2N7_9DINO|nr:unnamed protein product [Symbiodinium natans]